MVFTCVYCGAVFTDTPETDIFGMYVTCHNCGGSFDVSPEPVKEGEEQHA